MSRSSSESGSVVVVRVGVFPFGVLSLPAMITMLHGPKTGRLIYYAVPTSYCKLERPGPILACYPNFQSQDLVSQSYRCFAKPYCGLDLVKYLARRARGAR